MGLLAALALAAWLGVLLLPSRPWSTRERFEPDRVANRPNLRRVAVLIPARNEADSIAVTLAALARQGQGLSVVVVDDRSDDGTAAAVRAAAADFDSECLTVESVAGDPLPDGWGGKLWALAQGFERIGRDYCLLLDAEIVLEPGVLAGLLARAEDEERALVSVMAKLRCQSFWEWLLVPPFIFFFKLIYPFAAVNSPRRRTAAAAGGCILVRADVVREIGGFEAIRDALIDDCTLAARVKAAGHAVWLGLSESVRSARPYQDLASFRRMVTRTAFTQLKYSIVLLALVIVLMVLVFVVPWLAVVAGPDRLARLSGAAGIVAMAAAYLPVVRFYRLPTLWALSLPVAGILFAAMTVESAVNYWRGTKAAWKGRNYSSR